jgi:probable rRNA maturation factor
MFEIESNICVDEEIKFNECANTLAKILSIENLLIVEVNFVTNQKIQELNKALRGIDKVTDVISIEFGYEEQLEIPQLIGEIYLSKEYIENQARELNHSYKREINFIFVHGLLHLLGYDHNTNKEEEIMFKIQEEVLIKNEINR